MGMLTPRYSPGFFFSGSPSSQTPDLPSSDRGLNSWAPFGVWALEYYRMGPRSYKLVYNPTQTYLTVSTLLLL